MTFLQLNRLPQIRGTLAATGGFKPDMIHAKDSGFALHANIDQRLVTFVDDVSGDGFLLFLDEIPTFLTFPIGIPADADVAVTLSPPKRVKEISNCRDNANLPPLKYFENYGYDPHGLTCMYDKVCPVYLYLLYSTCF